MAKKEKLPEHFGGNMVRQMIFLRPDQVKRLQDDYRDIGVRPAEAIRRALDVYFSKPIPKRRRR
jgi:hypothetical protein